MEFIKVTERATGEPVIINLRQVVALRGKTLTLATGDKIEIDLSPDDLWPTLDDLREGERRMGTILG